MKKLVVNPVNKAAKKHVSRKLKSSWRKHIDTTDVDDFLEQTRQDERIGTLTQKQNTELFTEEKKPGRPKLSLREQRIKKFNELPKFLEPLKNTSQVPDPVGRRNVRANRKPPVPVVAKPVKRPGVKRNKASVDPDAVQKDLWADDEKLPEELRSEWIGKEQLLYTLKNVGKPLVLNLPNKMDKAAKIAAQVKHLPKEGASYNPAIDDYIELKNQVVEQERKIQKRKAHFDRVVTGMFAKVTPEEKNRRFTQEMSEGLHKTSDQPSEEEDETADTAEAKVALAKKRKRGSKTKRRENQRRLYQEKKLKEELVKLKDITRVKEISEEINKQDQKLAKRALNKSKARPGDDLPVDFIDPSALSGSLRTIQPLNNLIATGLPKVRKVAVMKTSRAETNRKGRRPRKKVRMVRRSHKIEEE